MAFYLLLYLQSSCTNRINNVHIIYILCSWSAECHNYCMPHCTQEGTILSVSILGTDRGTALPHTGSSPLTVTFWICSIREAPLVFFTNYCLDIFAFFGIVYTLFGYLTSLDSPFERYGPDYTNIKLYYRAWRSIILQRSNTPSFVLKPPSCINKFP